MNVSVFCNLCPASFTYDSQSQYTNPGDFHELAGNMIGDVEMVNADHNDVTIVSL